MEATERLQIMVPASLMRWLETAAADKHRSRNAHAVYLLHQAAKRGGVPRPQADYSEEHQRVTATDLSQLSPGGIVSIGTPGGWLDYAVQHDGSQPPPGATQFFDGDGVAYWIVGPNDRRCWLV